MGSRGTIPTGGLGIIPFGSLASISLGGRGISPLRVIQGGGGNLASVLGGNLSLFTAPGCCNPAPGGGGIFDS